ncbi:hypothetical protein PG991_004682 [Apiospora marii]|uniref:Uncharacterized protein n=1 Tax=Apiospora marii TaxID=335849 RepID=A0ABR1S736_9PEZI
MEVPLRKLTDDEIDALTNLLSRRPNYGIAVPSQKWLSRQQDKVERLPEMLLEPKSRLLRQVKRLSFNARKVLGELDLARPLPERAVLCGCHERLNPFLIRECFWLLCLEIGEHVECLRRWPHKGSVMASWLTRLESVTAYFMSKEHFHRMFGCAPHDSRFVRVVSKCEACILAAVGANGRCLADLFTALTLRQEDLRAGDARRRYKPRLLRFVDSWIRQMRGDEERTIRRWIDELLTEMRPAHLEIRSFWRDYQATEKRKRRERRKRESGGREADGRGTRGKRQSRHANAAPRINVDHATASEQRRLYRESETRQSVYRDDSIANMANMAAFKPALSPADIDGAYYDTGEEEEEEQGQGPPVPHAFDGGLQGRGGSEPISDDETVNDLDQDPEDRGAGYSAHSSHRKVSQWYIQCLQETSGSDLDPEDIHPAIRQEESQVKNHPKGQAKSYFSVKSAVPQPLRKGRIPEEDYQPVRAGWTKSSGAEPSTAMGRVDRRQSKVKSEWTDLTVQTELPRGVPATNAPPVPRVPSRFGQRAASSFYADTTTPRPSSAASTMIGSPTTTVPTSLDPDEYRPVSPLTTEGSLTPTERKFKNPWTQSEHDFSTSIERQSDRPPLFDRRELLYPDSEFTAVDPSHDANYQTRTANKRYLAQKKAVDPGQNPFLRQGSTRTRRGRGHQDSANPQHRQQMDQDELMKLRRDLSLSRRADPDLLAEDSASCVAAPYKDRSKSNATTWSQVMQKGDSRGGRGT